MVDLSRRITTYGFFIATRGPPPGERDENDKNMSSFIMSGEKRGRGRSAVKTINVFGGVARNTWRDGREKNTQKNQNK